MSEWISVKDRPPEVPCLVWDRYNGVTYATGLNEIRTKERGTIYIKDDLWKVLLCDGLSKIQRGKWSQAILDGNVNSYKYWMPLPEPPEGEKMEVL